MADEGRGKELPQAAAREQDRSGGSEVTTPSVRSRSSLGEARPDAEPDRAVQPVRAANAGPVTEDEVTEWLGIAGRSPSAATPGAAGPEPDAEPESASWLGAGLAALIVIPALVLGSLSVVAIRHLTGMPGSGPPSAAPARHEAAVRAEAAAWVAQQVSPGVTVSCDQAICAALAARGFPRRDLLALGPVSPDPRHSTVVVETAAVRALFGTSLDLAWAPAVLASFGSGPAGITVRVIASHGAAAYQTVLVADLAARKAAGTALLKDRQISIPAPARAQLAAGLVDMRVLQALTALSKHQPVSLVDFGNSGPGASPGIPLRFADLSATGQVIARERDYLSALKGQFRPVRTVPVVLPDGQAVLRVEFTAPSPLRAPGS
jgi:hypothetical protein